MAELTQSSPGGGLPEPERLAKMSEPELDELDRGLEQAERELRRRLAPLQGELAELTAQRSRLATERRRRERQLHLRQRQQVRAEVAGGSAPSLMELVAQVEAPELGEPEFTELEFLLDTGGVVQLGYPGSRSPSLQMTDGRATAVVTDLAEARRLYREGWELGVPARPGVRVHTPGTRLERLLAPDRCFVRRRDRDPGTEPATS
ncbi:MAG: hypothetical protein WBU92_10480 [Candidatus Dormiibacterota bacterium]